MLSEEKIDELIDSVFVPEGLHPFARAIKAAVLEEQAKAEPVAWLGHDDFGYNVVKMAKDGNAVIPLYLHPSPAPEGMVLVPREVLNQCLPIIEAAINRAVKENFGRCDENAHKYIDLLDAMLAAAEKEAGKC